MKFIDKSRHLRQGYNITDRYLNELCRIDDGNGDWHYQNVDYDGSFNSSGAKSDIQEIVLVSQQNYCCYCMRDLNMQSQRITLEHIIPQSCSKAEFDNYISLKVNNLSASKVVLTSDFSGVQNIGVPPRPHTITIENLVASCDGTFPNKDGSSQCCNNKRGNKEIYPLFYVDTVDKEITYTSDGTMQPNENCTLSVEYRQTINNVRLNCSNLKDIRRLWHLFQGKSIQVLESCLRDKNLRNKILIMVLFGDNGLEEQDSRILTKFMKDDYWRTFLMYRWFHNKI